MTINPKTETECRCLPGEVAGLARVTEQEHKNEWDMFNDPLSRIPNFVRAMLDRKNDPAYEKYKHDLYET